MLRLHLNFGHAHMRLLPALRQIEVFWAVTAALMQHNVSLSHKMWMHDASVNQMKMN